MRAHSRGVLPAARQWQISYSGREISVSPGDSVASALIAVGERWCRETDDGDRRGVFCGMGVCAECTVVIDGTPGRLACMTPVRDGMAVDVQPPRPVLPAPTSSDTADQDETELHPDVLVVGGGPAGLVAAAVAAEAGLDVVLVDERAKPGGQYFKQPAAAFTIDAGRLDSQFRAGRSLIDRFRASGARHLAGVRVWGAFAPDHLTASGPDTRWVFRPRQLVLATGAYERGVPLPGWTLPGVLTTGAAQTLLRSHQVSPGDRVLVSGNGPLNLQVGAELRRAGVVVVAVAELGRPFRRPVPGLRMALAAPGVLLDGLGYLTTLARHRVRRLSATSVIRCDGDTRVRTATLARIDAGGRPVPGTEQVLEVDAVCLGFGFLPSNELARSLGCEHRVDSDRDTLEVVRDDLGRTTVPGVWVVGDAGAPRGAAVALAAGAICGAAVVRELGVDLPPGPGEDRAIRRRRRQLRFQRALTAAYRAPLLRHQLAEPDTLICRCENVTLGELTGGLAVDVGAAGSIKRVTRAGMGKCQGRYCGPVVAQLAAAATGLPVEPRVRLPDPGAGHSGLRRRDRCTRAPHSGHGSRGEVGQMTRRTRFRIEAALAAISGIFFLLTVFWEDWIEIIFGVDPDNGDGSAEWKIAVGAAVLTVIFAVLARIDWRHLKSATA